VRDGTHPLLAGFVRVAFHDCVGISCDGCINQQQVHNKGLLPYIKALDDTYRTHKMRIHEWMSQVRASPANGSSTHQLQAQLELHSFGSLSL